MRPWIIASALVVLSAGCAPTLEEGDYEFELELDDVDCAGLEEDDLGGEFEELDIEGDLKETSDGYEMEVDFGAQFGEELDDIELEGKEKDGKIVLTYEDEEEIETGYDYDDYGNPVEDSQTTCTMKTTIEMVLKEITDSGEEVSGELSMTIESDCGTFEECTLTFDLDGGLD